MANIMRLPISLARGFYPSTASTGANAVKDAAVDGRNVLWLGPGLMKSSKGLGLFSPVGLGGTRLYVVNNTIATVRATGSVFGYRSGLYYFLTVETGANLVLIPAASVSLPGTNGRLQYRLNNATFNAGLAAPTTVPTLTASTTAGVNNSAATIVKITKIRTGMMLGESSMARFEESNPGPPSLSLAVENKRVKIGNFPSVPAVGDPDFYDAYGLYVSPSNAGNLPGNQCQFLRSIPTSAVVAGFYETEWNDNEIDAENPPTDHFPPPTGMFVAGLGNVIFIIGSRGGVYFSPSLSGNLGAFPPLAEGLMSPPEAPIGFVGRATEAELIVWTMNSLQSFLLSGNPLAPIYNRAIWPSTGIASPTGGCFAERSFYCFVAKSGPTRLGDDGQPDTAFALPVRNYIQSLNWDPAVVSVGYDPINNGIIYSHVDDAMVYMRDLDIWCVPIRLNANLGQPATLLTFQGQLIVSKGAALFTWEGGLVDQAWFLTTAKQDAPDPMDRKNLTGFRIHCDMTGLVAKLFIDDADSVAGTPEFTLNDMGSGKHYTSWNDVLLNVPCKNYQLRISGTQMDQRLDDIEFEMLYVQGLRDLL